MQKDNLFREKREKIDDFHFGQATAQVFDDMLDRSVPFYGEIQRLMAELSADFAVEGSRLYDLGCSTGNTLVCLDQILPPNLHFVGVDASAEMLEQARTKLTASGTRRSFELVQQNLEQGLVIQDASVVILNLTLQFVRPIYRDRLIADLTRGLREEGCLILVEKLVSPNPVLNRLFIRNYYQFKQRNGYSELEIAQKREALENVLIPYQFEENRELLLRNGFVEVEVFFRWYNFCGMIAVMK